MEKNHLFLVSSKAPGLVERHPSERSKNKSQKPASYCANDDKPQPTGSFCIWRGADGHIRVSCNAEDALKGALPIAALVVHLREGYALEVIPAATAGALPIMRLIPEAVAGTRFGKTTIVQQLPLTSGIMKRVSGASSIVDQAARVAVETARRQKEREEKHRKELQAAMLASVPTLTNSETELDEEDMRLARDGAIIRAAMQTPAELVIT